MHFGSKYSSCPSIFCRVKLCISFYVLSLTSIHLAHLQSLFQTNIRNIRNIRCIQTLSDKWNGTFTGSWLRLWWLKYYKYYDIDYGGHKWLEIELQSISLRLYKFARISQTPLHCVKSVQTGSFFCSLFSRLRTECRKIRTRKNLVFRHFSRSVTFTQSVIQANAFLPPKRFWKMRMSKKFTLVLVKIWWRNSQITWHLIGTAFSFKIL